MWPAPKARPDAPICAPGGALRAASAGPAVVSRRSDSCGLVRPVRPAKKVSKCQHEVNRRRGPQRRARGGLRGFNRSDLAGANCGRGWACGRGESKDSPIFAPPLFRCQRRRGPISANLSVSAFFLCHFVPFAAHAARLFFRCTGCMDSRAFTCSASRSALSPGCSGRARRVARPESHAARTRPPARSVRPAVRATGARLEVRALTGAAAPLRPAVAPA